jgi:hypothetical protein
MALNFRSAGASCDWIDAALGSRSEERASFDGLLGARARAGGADLLQALGDGAPHEAK